MPYNMRNLPEPMKGKSKKSKEIFIATFNSVLKDSGKEDQAFAIAYAAVDKHEKKVKQLKKSQGDLPWHLRAALQLPVEITKSANEELMQVTFVAMTPGIDLHGDYTSVEEIRKAKESFNINNPKSNLFHLSMTDSFSVIESYQTPVDMILNDVFVEKGAWLVTLQINEENLWQMIKDGEINGVSIGALAKVEPVKEEE